MTELSTGLDSNAQRFKATAQAKKCDILVPPLKGNPNSPSLFSALFLDIRRSFTYNTLASGSTIGVVVYSGLSGMKKWFL
jgi:hypothetical protein